MKYAPDRPLRHHRLLFAVLVLGLSYGLPVAADPIDDLNRSVNVVDRRSQPLEVGGDDDGVFDCEDYARLKRRLLIAQGVPAADMHLWSVLTERGQRHMVLEVRGRILDNLTPWATPREKVSYYRGWWRRD